VEALATAAAWYAAIEATLATIIGIGWEVHKWRRTREYAIRVGGFYSNVIHGGPTPGPIAGFGLRIINDSDFGVRLQTYGFTLADGQNMWAQNFPKDQPVIDSRDGWSSDVWEGEGTADQLEGAFMWIHLTNGRKFESGRFRNVPKRLAVGDPGVVLETDAPAGLIKRLTSQSRGAKRPN